MQLMTRAEVANFLRVSTAGVYRIVERRALRFYRIRGVLRFDRRDVEAFVRSGAVESISNPHRL